MNHTSINEQSSSLVDNVIHLDNDLFCHEVTSGLLTDPKHLNSKYFYDAKGDTLFQKIMDSPEYYLSRCELEIMKRQSKTISNKITQQFQQFDLIELGPGDASKSIYLLRALNNERANFRYIPIDISKHVIADLEEKIPIKIKGLKARGVAGEYLEMLAKVVAHNDSPKVILFLGSTIGNLNAKDALIFCKAISNLLNRDDLFFIGFDLIKDPKTILAAYNDAEGITRDFNLNLLVRINRELGADFDINSFKHFPSYNPINGLCKSYLISQKAQSVFIEKSNTTVHFKKYEAVFMETSKKYRIEETEKLAHNAGFSVERNFLDNRNWFLDSLWRKTEEQQVFPLSC